MVYNIFFWIHTISYIVWLLAFIGSLIYYTKIRNARGQTVERPLIRTERKITSIGAHIGAVGILISGGAMASIPSGPQWGWFNFSAHGWLALKQLIFCVILLLVVASAIVSVRFKKADRAHEGELADETLRNKWKKAFNTSLAVYLLVVVNTLLGWFRPF